MHSQLAKWRCSLTTGGHDVQMHAWRARAFEWGGGWGGTRVSQMAPTLSARPAPSPKAVPRCTLHSRTCENVAAACVAIGLDGHHFPILVAVRSLCPTQNSSAERTRLLQATNGGVKQLQHSLMHLPAAFPHARQRLLRP